jgi:hypothetical protein
LQGSNMINVWVNARCDKATAEAHTGHQIKPVFRMYLG